MIICPFKIIKLNHPYPSNRKDKKLMVYVMNPKTKRLNKIHFGQRNSRSNYSIKIRKRYLKRSEVIKDKKGRLTKNNPLSANYWMRKYLLKKTCKNHLKEFKKRQ